MYMYVTHIHPSNINWSHGPNEWDSGNDHCDFQVSLNMFA